MVSRLVLIAVVLLEIDPYALSWEKVTLTGFAVGVVVSVVKGWLVPGYAYQQVIGENIRLRQVNEELQQLISRATDTTEQAVRQK